MENPFTSSSEDRYRRPFHNQISGAHCQRTGPSSSSKFIRKRRRPGGLNDAERWFADNNQNVQSNYHQSFIDNDPPFYVDDSMLSKYPSDNAFPAKDDRFNPARKHNRTMSNGSGASHAMLSQCNCEEFRGVIDDLTVENRKLKRRLEKCGRLQPSHLAADKLFEVRMHGLSAQKKRDLEELLRCFVLNNATTSEHSCPDVVPQDTLQPHDRIPSQKSPSASTSCSRPIDSAYASMPASGQTSTVQSATARHHQWRPEPLSMSKQEDIQSYLHDIPQEIQPVDSSYLSDSAKKKLVVKRLEALFTGRVATDNEPSQPAQQQEVSHLAASADKKNAEAKGQRLHREGVREAQILPARAASASDPTSIEQVRSSRHTRHNHDLGPSSVTPGESSTSSKGIPDQRPTRPLDLDLQRAQVAAENVEYIRHLGFSSRKCGHTPEEDGGWVYLNLLTNMAQLHTVNVTLDFIRKAVSKISAKLELSTDGRKVRWLGGIGSTQTDSDSESFIEHYDEATANETDGARAKNNKRRKLVHGNEPRPASPIVKSGGLEESSDRVRQQRSYSLLNYKPLFCHGPHSNGEGDDYSHDSDSSPSSISEDHLMNHKSTAIPSALLQPSSHASNSIRHYGPITFYKNAGFCSDLSGDSLHITHGFSKSDTQVINITDHGPEPQETENKQTTEATLCGLEGLPSPPYIIKLDGHGETAVALIDVELPSLSGVDPSFVSRSPVEFEASGIGGVQPKDNFIIDVQVRHVKPAKTFLSKLPYLPDTKGSALEVRHDAREGASKEMLGKSTPALPRQIIDRLDSHWSDFGLPYARQLPKQAVKHENISVLKTELTPSQLPPPSYVFFSASSSEGDSAVSEDAKATSAGPHVRAAQSGRRRSGFPSVGSIANSLNSDCEGSGSDTETSIDLLAAAREQDPDAIAAYEREFDGCMGSVYTGEASAASSAATLGEESRNSCSGSFSDNDSEASL